MRNYIKKIEHKSEAIGTETSYHVHLHNDLQIVINSDHIMFFENEEIYKAFDAYQELAVDCDLSDFFNLEGTEIIFSNPVSEIFNIEVQTTVLKNGDAKDLIIIEGGEVLSIGEKGISLFDSKEHHDIFTTDIKCNNYPIFVKLESLKEAA